LLQQPALKYAIQTQKLLIRNLSPESSFSQERKGVFEKYLEIPFDDTEIFVLKRSNVENHSQERINVETIFSRTNALQKPNCALFVLLIHVFLEFIE
jgi:hypothetical protein